ncbi:arrestin domain-containing protein 17-like [Planococcus citri]|uniref:arrestin domain-containing protein 17-like n=1 Tax=Planococcus citri TaxID=170843 RepID=UPI0031F8B290
MSIARFCVIFDKLDKVYFPGEKVTGRVELELKSEKEIRGVQLKLKGKAECKWIQSNGKFTHNYKENETYIKSKQTLIGGKRFLDKFKLPKGKHIYPFSATLPPKAPASYSSSRGKVIYYAEAKIDIPLGFDQQERCEFVVVNPMDLNLYPDLKKSYESKKVKKFHYMCCVSSGPLSITVQLPKTGFAKSEPIPITFEINNASNAAVTSVEVYLKRKTACKAEGSRRKENTTLQRLRSKGVEEGQSCTWVENFVIPSIAFPFLDCCSLIKIHHELHIKVMTAGMHTNLNLHIPVTISDVILNGNPSTLFGQ